MEKLKLPTKEESHQNMLNDIELSKKAIFDLMEHNEMLDDDGYPTEEALDIIELWHWTDSKGWFQFIKSIWHLASWGWGEGEDDHEYEKNKKVYRYDISTAGWSGNESIIHAMNHNEMLWQLNWVQSRRGGHYIFELYEFADE